MNSKSNEYLVNYYIKNNIQMIRKVNKLRQEDIANALGIERSTYASWETGRSTPKSAQLQQLSKVFDCSMEFLCSDNTNKFTLNSKIDYNSDKKIYGDSFMIEISDEERALLLKYRLLSNKDKEELDKFIDDVKNKTDK